MNRAVGATALRFRDAVRADVAAVVALVESAYRGDASRAGWTTEADFLDGQRVDPVGVTDIVSRLDSRVLLLEESVANGGVAALLACCHLERQGDACYFGMFSVRPSQQAAGIGKMMLAEAERIARDEWGSRRLEMTVISIRSELIQWYLRRGYRQTGRFKPFPYGDERFGIPRRADLRFELLEKALDPQRDPRDARDEVLSGNPEC